MSLPNLTIAVTGLNNIDSPGPGIPVIRALKESTFFNARIIGLSYDALEPGIYMRNLVDKVYQIPMPGVGQEVLLNRLNYIHQTEKVDVLIPNFDAELFNFIKLENELKQMGIATFLPTLEQFEERQKWQLDEFGKKYNISVPYSKPINHVAEINSLAHEFGYPLVVKGKFYDAKVAYTPEQALHFFNQTISKWGLPIIIQQYTQGIELNLTGLGDGKGNLIGAVAMRKTYVTDKGKAWAGIALEDETMINIARNMVKQTKWRGGFELEMIKVDQTYYLIEINPRFPAWVYLAIGVGQNHPEALVLMAMGKQVKQYGNYKAGKMFVRYAYDNIVDLKDFETIATLGEL